MRRQRSNRQADWNGHRGILVALIAALSLLWMTPTTAEKRIALVVGNSAYQNITRLDNPRNDGRVHRKVDVVETITNNRCFSGRNRALRPQIWA
jgi:hypothetical protein